MAVREILLFPDPGLKKVCEEAAPGQASRDLLADLADTLYSSPGVGLAAPQIRSLVRAVVVDVTRKPPSGRAPAKGHGLISVLNPKITKMEGELVFREGCLSIPEFLGNVKRAAAIRLEGLNPDGEPFALETEGFEAVAVQHELDHLDGILFLDRVTNVKTDLFRRKIPSPPKP